jgi:hypothetical protein
MPFQNKFSNVHEIRTASVCARHAALAFRKKVFAVPVRVLANSGAAA